MTIPVAGCSDMKMAKSPKMLFPEPFATTAFTDASEALVRLEKIFARNTEFLRSNFEAYLKGAPPKGRVRATYPFVRVTTTTHSRLDSHPSYGFVSGPGTHETTITRPILSHISIRISSRLRKW